MKNLLLLFSLILLFQKPVFSQNVKNSDEFRKAMVKVNEAYLKSYPLKSSIEYLYYSNYNQAPDISQKYTVYSDTSAQIMVSSEIESIQFDTLKIAINHKEKMVVVEKVKDQQNSFPKDFLLDSLWKDITSIQIKDKGTSKTYLLELKSGLFSKLEFEVSNQNGLLKKVRIYASQQDVELSKSLIEIRIGNATNKGSLSGSSYLKNRVLISSRGKVSLRGDLSSYQLLTPSID